MQGTPTKKNHQGDLKIKESIQLHEAIIMRELHNEELQLFRESAAIENTLKSQIVALFNTISVTE